MKTIRLAVPANTSGGSYHRVSVPAFRIGNRFSALKPSHWICRAAAVGLLLTALSFPASAVNLAWNPNPESDIARYELSYGTSPGSRAVTVNAGLNTTASVTGLQAGATYYFVVSAINQSGLKSAPSAEISHLEPDGTSPPPVDPPPSAGAEIPTTGWTVKYASSEETEDEDGSAENAIDGNPNTYWISRWLTNTARPPHDLQIDTGKAQSIQGFRYLPRQDGYDIGNIGQYEFHVSMDGVNWGAPVATGTFANSNAEKEVLFPAKTGRYVQLRALTDLNGGAFNGGILCCVAELKLLQGSIASVPENRAPVAAAQSITTSEDKAVAIRISASDADGDSLGYAIVSGPGKGYLSGTAPNLTYTPNADENGTDSFTFRANDAAANSNTATVSITITPVNDAPVAAAGSVITEEDTLVSITLSASDKDSGSLTYAIVNAPGKGTLSGTAPNLSYRPNADANGTDSFTFRANDGTANSNTATVSITITPVNDAPLAASKSVATVKNTPVSIVLSATDIDSNSLSYAIVNGPAKGAISGSAPNLTYLPASGFSGTDSFTYRVNDGSVNSNTATVSITVADSNDAPVAASKVVTTAEDTPVSIVLSASDADGDSMTYVITGGPGKGTLSGSAPNLSYRPSADSNGTDSFTFRANDGAADSNTATVLITITPVNDAPVAAAGSAVTKENVPVSIVLAATDKDGDPLSYAIVTGPGKGSLGGAAPNLTYTPTSGFIGADSFSFRANDGAANSNVATISITVDAIPPPSNIGPSFVVNPIVMTVAEDQSLGGQLSAIDPDETGSLTFSKLSGPSWLTVSAGGQLGGTPSNGDVGVNAFSVRVTDSANASATASLLVTVTNTNDAPVFTVSPINLSAGSEEVPYSGASIAETAADPDAGDVITFSKVSGPEWLVVSESGELSGTPPAGSSGMNTFVVRVTDEAGATGDSVLQIQISSSDLPLPWSVEDLAGTGRNNRVSYESESFTLESSGRISGSSDSGCYVWQSFRGNGMIIARLTAAHSDDRNFLAGVMIRDSLASNSRHVFMGVDGRGGFQWARRTSTGGRTRTSGSGYGRAPDVWLALVRKGQAVSAYKSTDGSRWSMVGSVTTELGDNCYIGLATGTGGRSSGSATFSEVNVRN